MSDVCIHYCGKYRGADGNWYVKCLAVDGDKPSEECNDYCVDHETEEEDDV